jgi:hypothetical protein
VSFAGNCLLGNGTSASGIVVVDTTQTPPVAYAMGLNPGKTDGFMFVGPQSSAAGSSGLTFNLLQAYTNAVQAGTSLKLNISGSCVGTWVQNTATPVAATFEGVVGYSATTNSTRTLSNCTPAVVQDTTVEYFNSSYAPLGETDTSPAMYGKFNPVPTIPTSATVGSSGALSTMQLWTDATKTTPAGSIAVSYSLLPDTTTTAIARLTFVNYNTSSQVTATVTKNYRLSTSGALQFVGMTVAYANGLTLYYQ